MGEAAAGGAAPPLPAKGTKFSDLPANFTDKYELEDEGSTALITGKYNMKMLTKLTKMEVPDGVQWINL